MLDNDLLKIFNFWIEFYVVIYVSYKEESTRRNQAGIIENVGNTDGCNTDRCNTDGCNTDGCNTDGCAD